jgi:hypothetical protein
MSLYNPWVVGFSFPSAWSASAERQRAKAQRDSLRKNAIDRELASGVDPDSTAGRRRRARELTSSSSRRTLAAAYDRHLAAATGVPPPEVVPVNWRGVRVAATLVEHLTQRLREDSAIRVQGVARARLLLADSESALFDRDDDSAFGDAVRSTLALL